MFTHCLSCQTPLSVTGLLGHRVRGECVAYDPERGRLWSICRTCGGWSLAPIEERWETVEELERITTRTPGPGRPRLLSRTDNVALFQHGRLRIVRIGRSNRLEEAWWRYGRDVLRRWREARGFRAGRAVTAGAAIVGGVLTRTLPGRYAFRSPTEVRRWLRFGDRAWRGRAACAICGHPFRELSYFDRKLLELRPPEGDEAGPGISHRCRSCGDALEGGLQLRGLAAAQTLRRMLAYEHFGGAPEDRIRAATRLIEREGSSKQLMEVILRYTHRFGDLPAVALTTLEIAGDEARERRLLQMEVAALERHWREAEALASIVDSELTWVSGVDRLRRIAVGD